MISLGSYHCRRHVIVKQNPLKVSYDGVGVDVDVAIFRLFTLLHAIYNELILVKGDAERKVQGDLVP